MTQHEFINELKRLHCIEGWSIEGLSQERQAQFVVAPVQFLLRADDETQRQIWLAMERDREKWGKPFAAISLPQQHDAEG